MLIYCYFNKEIYINWCFVDVMKIHPTLVRWRNKIYLFIYLFLYYLTKDDHKFTLCRWTRECLIFQRCYHVWQSWQLSAERHCSITDVTMCDSLDRGLRSVTVALQMLPCATVLTGVWGASPSRYRCYHVWQSWQGSEERHRRVTAAAAARRVTSLSLGP